MRYLALGDSISIDAYTGVAGGGAASQFAQLIRAESVRDLTRDGNTTDGVLADLDTVREKPDMVTLTAGGNDFLLAAGWGETATTLSGREALVSSPLSNLSAIVRRLKEFRCPVIINTIYDPTDRNDNSAQSFGFHPSLRLAFYELNDGIRALARAQHLLLSDLHLLFAGHGIGAAETWIVNDIEPNLAGATAIAMHWYSLFQQAVSRL